MVRVFWEISWTPSYSVLVFSHLNTLPWYIVGTVLGYFEQLQAEKELFVPEFIDNKKKRLHKELFPLTLETG